MIKTILKFVVVLVFLNLLLVVQDVPAACLFLAGVAAIWFGVKLGKKLLSLGATVMFIMAIAKVLLPLLV